MKCAICGKEMKNDNYKDGTYLGNNPWPVIEDPEARCCDECNATKVIPARIELMYKNKK